MKKTISMVIVLAICLSLSVSGAYAHQSDESQVVYNEALALVSELDIAAELQDAQEGIIDPSVRQEVLDNISLGSSDGADVAFTVKHLGSITKKNNGGGEIYALTARSSKVINGSSTEDNVDCWITLVWVDNLGPSNEIVSVSGGWDPNGRTLSDRQVYYGIVDVKGAFLDGESEDKFPSKDSYYYEPSTSLVGSTLRAYSYVRSAGYSINIFCGVKPTIFD